VFCESVWKQTSLPVEIVALTPKISKELGISTDGTNAFSKIRFAIPYLCDFKGWAIWVDGADMLLRSDLAELWKLREGWFGVQVVKHDYTPTGRKYIGTDLESPNEAYPKKNWSSVVIWQNGYMPHRVLTPQFIAKTPGSYLHRFAWMPEERVGELPKEWNWLVREYPDNIEAKICHWTLGSPFFRHYAHDAHAGEWRAHYVSATKGLQTEVSER
jgi:hypothetical protein